LEILRDLFDVSVFRHLAAKLKADAEAAERQVREEREVCARRLTADGFESTDALAKGIADAESAHAEHLRAAAERRAELKAAQTAHGNTREIEGLFVAAETARKALDDLQARSQDMGALGRRVQDADRVRGLIDVETRLRDAEKDVAEATTARETTKCTSETADETATKAAEKQAAENARAGEIDDLRREIETLERHKETLNKSATLRIAVESAAGEVRKAQKAFDDARGTVDRLTADRRTQEDALKKARQAEGNRQSLQTRLTTLQVDIKAAETFEKGERDLRQSGDEVDRLKSAHDAFARRTVGARSAFDNAERRLAAAQALHLAAKLKPGDPCPVCGATDHPAPATGRIEHAGLDKVFRGAKQARDDAEAKERQAAKDLAAAEGTLAERKARLDDLKRPDHVLAALWADIETCRSTIAALGPETDISAAEERLGTLSRKIDEAEEARDHCRVALGLAQTDAATARTRLDEMLSGIPQDLRHHPALEAAVAERFKTLNARVAAQQAADKAATVTREAALSARKEFEAAEKALEDHQRRKATAQQSFEKRLVDNRLTEKAFLALKPAIATIEVDRARLDAHSRQLEIARAKAQETQTAIEGQERPDLTASEDALRKADDALTSITDLRAQIAARLDHLRKLQQELAEVLQRLDKAEAESAPLRGLAAVFDAQNPQKLDLETFAIGAMFDQVLVAANQRLGPMTAGRYTLEREFESGGRGRRGLGIQVFDVYTGKARSTSTLSGGETFIAALALALGLADVVESASGKVHLDTIFIDEGFSSLDTENGSGTLDQVLQAMNSLVRQSRAVGVISHVPLVQEAIPNGFYIRKDLLGSRVESRGII